MANWTPIIHVTGRSRTYTIYRDGGGFISGYSFLVKDDSGKGHGIYDDKATALRVAEKKAGADAHISHL